MLVYHVTHDLSGGRIKRFVPRIPESAGGTEDTVTPRICVSTSIIGCFSGLGYIDEFVTSRPFMVYEANVPESWLLTPDVLLSEHNVIDAMCTQEHWCMRPITMIGNMYRVKNYERDNYLLPAMNPEAVDWIKQKFGAITAGLSEHELLNDFIRSQGLDEDDLQEMFDVKGIRVFTKMQLEVVYEKVT